MPDLRILKQKGVSAEAWKKIFEGRKGVPATRHEVTKGKRQKDKLDELQWRIWSRCTRGRDYNISNYRVYHALDLIWESPFRQVNPTLIANVINNAKNTKEVRDGLNAVGLNIDSVLLDTGQKDEKTGQPIKKVSIPAFFTIIVPLVRAYLDIRKATLVNQRNNRPIYKYEASVKSLINRTRTKIINSRVQTMADQYDYLNDLDQSVFNMLLYSHALKFTQEEWHKEEQEVVDEGKEMVPGEEHEDGSRDDDTYPTKTICVKEGLRRHIPHPGRTYWDLAHPMISLNTDTGCTYCGHWKVMRYGELRANKAFYNLDRVSIGDGQWWSSATGFFNTILNSCVINVPTVATAPESSNDREGWLAMNNEYTVDMDDKSVAVFEHREKIIPKDWGLGDYEHPIWARFVVAGDGSIIYACPMGYTPATVYRDMGDSRRREEVSLALKLAPFQDQLSNLLSQYLLAAKQNLINITMVDENVLREEDLDTLRNYGERFFREINLITFDSKKSQRMQTNIPQAFYSHRFPPLDTNAIVQAMKVVIDLAERVLQFSAQEVAQAATHEQTRAEINQIAASTNNVLTYTGIAVDNGMHADARQCYDALMNYGEDEFYAEVPNDEDFSLDVLAALGITQDDDDEDYEEGESKPYNEDGLNVQDDTVTFKIKKTALRLNSFAFTPNTQDRTSNVEAAAAMATFVRDLLNNGITAPAIGPKQAIMLANQIAELAGIPLDQKLKDMTGDQMQEQAQQILKQVMDQVLSQVQPIAESVKQNTQMIQEIMKSLGINLNGPNGQTESGGVPGGEGANPDGGGAGAAPPLAGPTGGGPVPPPIDSQVGALVAGGG